MKNTLKRAGAVMSLAVILAMFMAMFSFADSSLEITKTYPANNAKNTTKENMCVKVMFSSPVGNAASKKANADKFKITDKNGHKLPVKVYYNKQNTKYALILVDTAKVPQKGANAIQDNQYYTCTIEKGFRADNGSTLAADRTIRFKTLNQRTYTMGYMVMMVLMFGGMMFFGVRQMRNQNSGASKEKTEDTEAPFNPYKEAKKTGKDVQTVIAEHEKEEKKEARKQKAKKKKKPTQDELIRMEEEKVKKELRDDFFHVKKPMPIKAAGAKFTTGRAARAAALKKKREAERAALKASGYGKKKKTTENNNNNKNHHKKHR